MNDKTPEYKNGFSMEYLELPKDRFGKAISIGSKLDLEHNGKRVTVKDLEYIGPTPDRWRIWPEESGGGFILPDCSFNVTRVS